MDYDGRIRASDADRETVVDILRGAYTEGRLDLGEFDERTTAAYAARTWAQLRELTGDLPVDVPLRRPPGALVGPVAGDARGPRAAGGGPPPAARRPGFFPVVPFLILFLVLAGSAHTAALALLPVFAIVLFWLRVAVRQQRRGGHRPGSGFPPGPGSGQA